MPSGEPLSPRRDNCYNARMKRVADLPATSGVSSKLTLAAPSPRSPVQLFTHYLKSQGLNVTRVRRRIVEAVFASPTHLTAPDLWLRLRGEPGVSMATIYRTLDLLVAGGLVRKLDLGSPYAHYEPLVGHAPHEHLICTRCHQIVEFTAMDIEERLLEAAERHGFLHQRHDLKIYGLCPGCQSTSPQIKITKEER
jgi:Fur family ferric uptake transcriptional regulator